MKNILKSLIALLLIICFSCKAQTTATLLQMEECRNRSDKSIACPGMESVTHVKDLGNRLNAFEGTWIGNFDGKQIELKLEKK